MRLPFSLWLLKLIGVSQDSVKYYDMEFKTDSPNYYPIECDLVKQMTYFTGTYPLYHSTLYSNDIFKNTFIKEIICLKSLWQF